jgi:FkbM family methyltransferase
MDRESRELTAGMPMPGIPGNRMRTDTKAMSDNERVLSQSEFLIVVKSTLAEFVAQNAGDPPSDSAEIEFPSASLDANAIPRFRMTLPASLICSDLGAACVFYDDLAGRGFEFALRRFLDLHLVSDDVFIDVGAHFGIHSLTAATILPRQVSVLAIEPHHENSARLRSWVALNHLESDITVVPGAIGEREGTVPMWVSGSSMGHSLRTGAHEAGSFAIEVDVTTIDRLLEGHPQLRWRRVILKIDVEGCELEVLNGARNLFATGDVVAVIWEKAVFHDPFIQDQRDAAVFEFLDSRGFEHFRMESETLGGRLIPLESRRMSCNVYSLVQGFDRRERYG